VKAQAKKEISKFKKFCVQKRKCESASQNRNIEVGKFQKSFYLVGVTIISTKKHGVKKGK
jgi:hypothetical protein